MRKLSQSEINTQNFKFVGDLVVHAEYAFARYQYGPSAGLLNNALEEIEQIQDEEMKVSAVHLVAEQYNSHRDIYQNNGLNLG